MRKEVTTTLEIITPEVAGEYLTHNTSNRVPREETIRGYARTMREGNWRPNPSEPISFADDGTLINGQHRLQAVIKAGIPICMAVLRGADKKDFEVIDTGKKRSGGDLLSIAGVENSTRIAALIKSFYAISKGSASNTAQGTQHTGMTNKMILDEYMSSPGTYQTIGRMARHSYRTAKYLKEAEYGGIMAYLIKGRHHDIEQVRDFFEELATGGRYMAISNLRNDLTNDAIGSKSKFNTQGRRVLISKAWNLYIAGRDQKKIVYRTGDNYHFD